MVGTRLGSNSVVPNGRKKSMGSGRSWPHMAGSSWIPSAGCVPRSWQSEGTTCSKCCMMPTSRMTPPCQSMRIIHPHGPTRWTIKYSTSAWSPLVLPNHSQAFGKYPWSCGKISRYLPPFPSTNECKMRIWEYMSFLHFMYCRVGDAQWGMPVRIRPLPKASMRCSSRTLSATTRRTELRLGCTTTPPGSRRRTTRKGLSPSWMSSSPWRMFGWSRIGRHSSGYETPSASIKASSISHHSTAQVQNTRQ